MIDFGGCEAHFPEVVFEHEQEASLAMLELANLVVGVIEPNRDANVDEHKHAGERHERPKVSPGCERLVVVPRGRNDAIPRAL